jgi:hypothetical protein
VDEHVAGQPSGQGPIILGVSIIVFAVDHPWRLDLVSLAAMLAAAGTFILALFTWRLASDTRRLAFETGEDVRAEWRPVLIPEGTVHRVQYVPRSDVGTLLLSLSNVGRGPAINVSVWIESATSTETEEDPTDLGTIAPGKAVEARVSHPLFSDSSGRSRREYDVHVAYDDLATRGHETFLIFSDPADGVHKWQQAQGAAETFDLELIETQIDRPETTSR